MQPGYRQGMNASLLAVLMVISVGAMIGACTGLCIGFVLKKQKPFWSDMTGKEKMLNVALVAACSVISIAGLALVFLFR
jgi:hypothetical protein